MLLIISEAVQHKCEACGIPCTPRPTGMDLCPACTAAMDSWYDERAARADAEFGIEIEREPMGVASAA
jgi:hypothetical protein